MGVFDTDWEWRASATCPRNGPVSARCLVFPCGSHHIRTSLHPRSICIGETGFLGPETNRPKSPLGQTVSAETETQPQKPANCGLLGHLREISRFERVRGGAGRTRTSSQSVMSEPPAGREGEFFRPRLSTGLPAQEERACKIDRTAETSVSTPLCPALSGPEVVEGPIWARGPT